MRLQPSVLSSRKRQRKETEQDISAAVYKDANLVSPEPQEVRKIASAKEPLSQERLFHLRGEFLTFYNSDTPFLTRGGGGRLITKLVDSDSNES